MNIAVDTTYFGHQEIKENKLSLSTSLFTANLLDAFTFLGLNDYFTLVVNYNHEAFFRQRFPQYKLLVLKSLPLTLIWKLTGKVACRLLKSFGTFRRQIEKQNFDMIWFPALMNNRYYVESNVKSILTFHDLYRYHLENNTKDYLKILNNTEKNKVVSISGFTADDICKSFNYHEPIPVIPNSIQFEMDQTKPVSALEGKKYILDINAYVEKKNPMTLLKAFHSISDDINMDLVFCGAYKDEKTFEELESYINQNNLNERVHLLYKIDFCQRNWLLKNARLFVTPSCYEGFGRTPVEAAYYNIPVISTKETSLYEATQGYVNYYDNPKDHNELASLIQKKIGKPDSIAKIKLISSKLKKAYTPESCALRYWEIFMDNL